jgi:hypothetical protein
VFPCTHCFRASPTSLSACSTTRDAVSLTSQTQRTSKETTETDVACACADAAGTCPFCLRGDVSGSVCGGHKTRRPGKKGWMTDSKKYCDPLFARRVSRLRFALTNSACLLHCRCDPPSLPSLRVGSHRLCTRPRPIFLLSIGTWWRTSRNCRALASCTQRLARHLLMSIFARPCEVRGNFIWSCVSIHIRMQLRVHSTHTHPHPFPSSSPSSRCCVACGQSASRPRAHGRS